MASLSAKLARRGPHLIDRGFRYACLAEADRQEVAAAGGGA